MWRLSHVLVKAFGTGLGVVCLYMAVFLYRDERDRIQNHLEDWWQKIRNKQATALSRHVALMQTVGDLTTRLYDRTFGESSFSVRAIVVSVCFSMVSLLFTLDALYIRANGLPTLSDKADMPIFGSLIIFLILSVVSVKKPELAKRKLWLGFVFILALLQLMWLLGEEEFDPHRSPITFIALLILYSSGILVLSFACDILFIGAGRWVVRRAAAMNNFWKISCVIVLNLSIAIGLCIYPLMWGSDRVVEEVNAQVVMYSLAIMFSDPPPHPGPHILLGQCVIIASASNAIDGLLASVFVVLAILMVVHRIIWPILARPVYALADLGMIQQRKLLGCVGLALLGFGIGKLPEFVKQVISIFVGK